MYKSKLDLQETELAIKALKDHFESTLAAKLNLTRVSAPLFVLPQTGLNDNLNGTERPVAFDIKETGCTAEIVHSLAKWKRYALKRYGFSAGEGLYTDMNAIRRDEICDELHSIYVDQYDWEKIITPQERNREYLRYTVREIYEVIHNAQHYLEKLFPVLKTDFLPREITFISTQELENEYPLLTPRERERTAAEKYGAIFLENIGGKLKSGKIHDGRAPDYDDWSLNAAPAYAGRAAGTRMYALSPRRYKRRASPDNRRRHRTITALHVFPAKKAHRRSSGFHMAGGYNAQMQH